MRFIPLAIAYLALAILFFSTARRHTAGTWAATLIRRLAGELGDLDPSEPPPSAQIRSDLAEAATRLTDLRNTVERQRGDTWETDVRQASNEVVDLDRMLEAAVRSEQYDVQLAAWQHALERAADGPESRGPEGAHERTRGDRRARSFGTETVLSEDYEDFAARAANGGGVRLPELVIEGRSMLSPHLRALVDSTTDDSGSDAGFFIPVGQPIAPVPRQQRFFLRDVLSVQETTLATIPYIRELNPATLEVGASAVAEGTAKPEVELDFEQDNAVVEVIAAWLPATMQVLADAPTLRGYIDTRLAYMLQVREQQQVLFGTGSSPQIKGILSFTTQEQAAVAGDVPATIATAIGKVENVDGDANGIAMDPLDYWGYVATRHTNQLDGDANGNAPFGTPAPTLWGEPVIRTRALGQGRAVVGDWAMGATLFDRMRTTIRQSDSHDDYFVKNKVAILAEERVALAVHRPDFFVDTVIDLTA